MTSSGPPGCTQAVTAEGYGDGCCGPQAACGAPGTWLHDASGLALCDEHELNARKYSFNSGSWRVGDVQVTYPAGWRRIADNQAVEASPLLEVVRLDS